jgi:DNA-binding transcriptional ArsR family regulator
MSKEGSKGRWTTDGTSNHQNRGRMPLSIMASRSDRYTRYFGQKVLKVYMVALLGRRSNPAKGTSTATVDRPSDGVVTRVPKGRLRRLSEAEIDELVAARLQGAEIRQLAEQFGVNRSTVDRHLRDRGVPKRRWQGRTLDAAQVRAAGELYACGVRLELVAQQFGVDRRYLGRVLAQAGFVIRCRGQQKRT